MEELVDMLSQIVQSDRGRASELTQARARRLQAVTGRDAIVAKLREVQVNLVKLVGEEVQWPADLAWESRVAETDVAMNRPGYLAIATTRAWLRKTQRGPDMDFILEGKVQDEPLNSWPLLVSNNVPKSLSKGASNGVCSSLIFSGDWSELLIAQFGELDVIVDPYTLASTATVRITVNQFVDIAVRQPKAFSVMEDGLTA